MADTRRTKEHDEIRRWVETRGGRPALLGDVPWVDFARGAAGTPRTQALRDVDWTEWFHEFDDRNLIFVCAVEPGSKEFAFSDEHEPEEASETTNRIGRWRQH